MKYVLLDELESIYQCAERISVRRISVPFAGLAKLSKAIRKFEWSLGELASEDDWQRFLRVVKRFKFDVSAALLSQKQLENMVTITAESLDDQIRWLNHFYPESVIGAKNLIGRLRGLAGGRMSYLYDEFMSKYDVDASLEGNSWAVVVKEARHVTPTAKAIYDYAGLEGWQVANARELDNVLCFENIVLIGAARWYPDYIFTAPRAERIDVLVYDFQSSSWEQKATLVSPVLSQQRDRLHQIRSTVGLLEYQDDDTNDEELGAGAAHRILGKGDNEGDETVAAQIVLLEGDNAVLLDASQEAKTLVIDLRTLSVDVVQKVPTVGIEPGMFVLLRTDEGGDYVIPLANKLLGIKAKQLRGMQMEWKLMLKNKVAKRGLAQVVLELQERGSGTANAQNVRNWMSYRGIKTRNQTDFKAIMVYLGMRKQSAGFWNAMVEIANAHRKAGFEMSRLLREEVERSDLTELRRMGVMHFELAEHEGGNMTAFRVLDVLSGRYDVSPHRIGKPESIEELTH